MGCDNSTLRGASAEEIPNLLKYHNPFENLIIIDDIADSKHELATYATNNTLVLKFSSNQHTTRQLCDMIKKAHIKNLSPFMCVGLVSHAAIGGEKWKVSSDVTASIKPSESLTTILQIMDLINTIVAATTKKNNGRVDIFGCNLLSCDQALVEELEVLYGLKFTVADDRTGEQVAGGSWIEETRDLEVSATYFDKEKLHQYKTSINYLDSMTNLFTSNTAIGHEASDALSEAIINKPGDFLSGKNRVSSGVIIKASIN